MGLQTYIGTQSFRSQLRNGLLFTDNPSDVTNFLQANVGEIVRVTTPFYYRWFSAATEFGKINVNSNGSLVKQNGDWVTDGWNVGDTFDAVFNDTSDPASLRTFSGTVDALVQDTMFFTLTSGSISSSIVADAGVCNGTNILDAAIFQYNLIENSDPINFNSLIQNEPNQYFVSGLTNPVDSFVQAQPSINGVNRTWQNGVVRCRNRGPNQQGFQEFEVEHTFIVLPYYLTGYSNNYQNGTLPSLFNGNNSLKYIIQLDARPQVGNANASKVVTGSTQVGNVGFYNESFNGFPNNFNKLFFGYTNNTALNPSGNNFCFGKVTNTTGSFQNGDRFTIAFSRLSDPNNFIDNTEYETQFLYSSVTQEIGNQTGLDDNCLQNVKGTVDNQGNLSFTFQLFFNANNSGSGNANLILPEEDYLIWVSVGSSGLTNNNDDRVNLILDYNNFNPANDVPDLAELNEIQQGRFVEVYNHLNPISNGVTSSVYDSFDGMVEDGYTYRFELLTRQDLGVIIQNMSFNMVARNSGSLDEFTINSYDFDLSSSLMVNADTNFTGQQQYLQLDTTRGFNLAPNDQFNLVSIETLPMVQIGNNSLSKYRITIGFKINWETWIANNNINVIFFDPSKPNDNLNNRVSNYSDELAYILYPRLDLILSNDPFTDPTTNLFYDTSSTLYKIFLPPSLARDYGDDSVPKKGQAPIHRCDIRTLKTSDGLSTNGNILTNEDTLIKAVFNRFDALPMGFSGYAGVIRIDIENGGLFSIEELSTLADNVPISNGLLKPIGQNTRTQITVGATNNFVLLECLIDKDKVIEGANYVISARLWEDDSQVVVGEKRMEDDTLKIMEDTQQKFIE